ncbi:cupin domain-containing protein [Streptomyces sp. NPDC005708]|jgi:2,4'-dihydroxyacetophenone dioxygenase|uniref:cupin domain-containing protein n=1 Tax=unclassified Streptomyces TaxID=2593676 RepID=UPI0033E322CB
MTAIYSHHPGTMPWIPVVDGVSAKPLRFTADGQGWASVVRIDPGSRVPRHRHTGDVQGVVLRGRCRYSPDDPWLEAGAYLHEADGAEDEVLACPEAGAEILFIVAGPRVEYLGDDGSVVHVDDQQSKRRAYAKFCTENGLQERDLHH